MTNVIALFDSETGYLLPLTDYLSRKKTFPYEVRSFTTEDSLLRFLGMTGVRALVVADKDFSRAIDNLKPDLTVILKSGFSSPYTAGLPAIEKYQSASHVARDIMNCLSGPDTSEGSSDLSNIPSAISFAVAAPSPDPMACAFAYSLACAEERNREVLFCDLTAYSSLGMVLHRDFTHSLSDLLCFADPEGTGFRDKAASLTEKAGGPDFIAPARLPEDILDISSSEWLHFLDMLTHTGGYDLVVFHTGPELSGLGSFLDQCSRIWFPIRRNPLSRPAVMQMFEDICESHPSLSERSEFPVLPDDTDICRGDGRITEELMLTKTAAIASVAVRRASVMKRTASP